MAEPACKGGSSVARKNKAKMADSGVGESVPESGVSAGFVPSHAKSSTFAEEIRNFLREQNGAGTERLRALLEQLCMEDPKAALQFLCSYAFGKPAERLDISTTVAGVPEKFIELFREDAKKL
jgi:hypothetical protein